jgi:hypothetical protein
MTSTIPPISQQVMKGWRIDPPITDWQRQRWTSSILLGSRIKLLEQHLYTQDVCSPKDIGVFQIKEIQ